MTAGGRPLRFLAIVVIGWIVVRIAMLWPVDSPAEAIDAIVPRLAAAPPPVPSRAARPDIAAAVAPQMRAATPARRRPGDPSRIALAMLGLLRFGPAEPMRVAASVGARPGLPLAPRIGARPGASRWRGSAWLVARNGGGPGAAFGGSQLGGSQAGVRIAYTIDRAHRLALAGRLSAPLSGAGRAAALGVEWQPGALPVRLVAEQRFSLDGGGGGPTVGIVGGIGPVAALPGITVEAYAQAGGIARDGIEGFADGAVRVARPLADLGKVRFDLGAGAWGAAQRHAARLDIGPSLSADLPLGRRAHLRLSLDWRARIAGAARPGTGLVLSIGTDF